MNYTDALLVILVLLGFASWVLFELMSSSVKDEDVPKKPTPPKKRKKDKKNGAS